MLQIFGEYTCSADNKGRLRLPTGLRQKIGEGELRFVVKRGFEGCLELWPLENWEQKRLEWAPMAESFDPAERMLFRRLTGGLVEITTDSADRINIPNKLLEEAGIDAGKSSAVILQGMGQKIEIWDETRYNETVLKLEDDFAEKAHEVAQKAMKRVEKPTFSIKVEENQA